MKKFFITILMVIIPVLSCSARSKIIFDTTYHDFGRVKTESSMKYTFNFRNAGSSRLDIDRIKAG